MTHDKIFSQPLTQIAPFQFDANVASVFENMIQRSVPGYELSLAMIGLLAKEYVQPHSHIYDLGCSLGAATLAMRKNIHAAHCQMIAIDNSAAMLSQCQMLIDADHGSTPVQLLNGDICDIPIINASMVTLNFTLQFVTKTERLPLLQKIYDGMRSDAVLILSEKIAFSDQEEQSFQTDMHHEFKKEQGYSDLEVSQKRTALENVLIPETLKLHQQRLHDAGFTKVFVWFQCFSFVSLVAIK
ncbi:MAG: carboxy-S-adenosyl-L-methionine synthase CmoA [Zetaproteobacteria bacterium]|nr:carboxy-S-adenosyl-L-methionine synthase CmoA [Zetaproteobacteria bacterium]